MGLSNASFLVLALPSKTKTKIKSIYFYDEEVQTASRRSSVTITLEDEINISRGDMITKTDNLPTIDKQFTATIAWMDRDTLTTGNKYVIQHGVNKVQAKVERIHHILKTDYSSTWKQSTKKSLYITVEVFRIGAF